MCRHKLIPVGHAMGLPLDQGRKEGAGRKKKRELAVITLLKEGRLDV